MTLKFTKMHGLGNDFIVIDAIHQALTLKPQQIRELSKRNTGIGFDQCLIIEKSERPDIDFNYRIFNADGNEVGQCGNGARCLALFVKHYGLTTKNKLRVATHTTDMDLTINADNSVSINMGIPRVSPQDIPFIAETEQQRYPLELPDHQVFVHVINVGNPHAVLIVDEIDSAPVATLGPLITHHSRFPEQANTGFMQILSLEHIKLRVYERGSGETLACGSGAVAAAAIGRLYYHMAEHIKISLPGGDLYVYWPNIKGPITLTGPGTFVYEGQLM